jgi:S-formylglutathione hydrolase FrmB
MGGLGALRLGSTYASRFRGISAHSAMTHLWQMEKFVEEDCSVFDANVSPPAVLDALLAAGPALPPLRFDCGVDDDLLETNRDLHRALEARGVAHTYEEFPGGHTWSYWEAHLDDTLRFFGKVLGQ